MSKDHILDLQWIKELVKESGGIPSCSKGKTPHEYSQSLEQEALFASLNFPNAKCQDKQQCCPLGRHLLGRDGLFSNHSLSDKPLPSSLHLVLTSTVCPPLSPQGEARPSAKPQAEQIEGLSPVGKRPNPTRGQAHSSGKGRRVGADTSRPGVPPHSLWERKPGDHFYRLNNSSSGRKRWKAEGEEYCFTPYLKYYH